MSIQAQIKALHQSVDNIVDLLSEMLSSGRKVSDELKNEIADTIRATNNKIAELEISGEPEEPQEPEEPELPPPELPQGTDLLWILSGGDQNAFVNYLRTYPGAGFKELASNPSQLASVIAYLDQENPIEGLPQAPDGIPDTQYPSSNVSGMKYDPRSGKLLVKFHGDKGEPVYQYDGVPQQIFKLLEHGNAFAQTKGKNKWGEWWPMKNPSIGASVNQYLKKGGYAYKRIR